MEDIAISDWPGQALDISGSNPWLPAYGFQSPSALLEREDFIGNPDAEYFLHGEPPQYVYLETIQEETSDDLRSESDISETRTSPVGWLATDSEAGSVIRIDIDDVDCESDREAACPAKRRKQEHLLTIVIDDDFQSLSRSSSLLQFETLEKQCQETCSSSPSIYSQFSFDSLDNQRKNNVSPDSLDRVQSDCQHDIDNFKRLELDDCCKKENSRDSLLYNATRYSGSDSSDTGNSDETLEASRSFDNLRTWRSFDSLPITNPTNTGKLKDKISAENLSEDSGYSDHLYGTSSYSKIKNGGTSLLNSVNNRINAKCATSMMKSRIEADYFGLNKLDIRNTPGDFPAYDGEGFQYFSGNFGASYQDLSVFDKYEVSDNHRSPLIDRFMRNRRQGNLVTKIVNIEKSSECERPSKYNCTSASEPNLQQIDSTSPSYSADSKPSNVSSNSFNKSNLCVCSVPKNLNLLSNSKCLNDVWTFEINSPSIASKNYDLGDLTRNSFKPHSYSATELEKSNCDSFHSSKSSEFVTINSDRVDLNDMSSFKREGSYAEAMSNRVDLSDDENSLTFQKKPQTLKPRNTLEDFDRKVLKAISETSIQSMASSKIDLDESVFTSTPMAVQRRNVASTPNLSLINKQELNNFLQEERRRSTHDIRRKESSYVNRSTSTSGMSDLEDKPVPSVKSLSESISSKGVHFSPVVSEVNWQDDTESTVTLERESSYSLQSSPERELTPPNAPIIIKPQARLPPPVQSQMTYSQPDLNPNPKEDFLRSLKSFREDFAKSQPNLSRFRRRGSQLIKKDKDGCVIKAYIDGDGFQYHHTHLDLDNIYTSKTPTTSTESHVGASNNTQSIHTKSVAGMDVRVQDAPRKDKGKFGGFFSRLASFRFSGRKDEKARKKKSVEPKGQLMTGGVRTTSPHQRIATKDDYIYIPLKGPPLTENNNLQKMHEGGSLLVSGKPPVPRAPPRVVGACVKKDGSAQGVGEQQERRRRRTIDSGSRPRPMEPMGLIETDLDTEVTVITDGANVKTRSLLNLGARPAQQQLSVAPRETHRPHKSMEFLLDKQNLKVVEPPENELQKGERVMSEHQLRVQRSLQKLTIPDWYKQSQIPQEGFLLKKNATRESRWTGTGNKTTSLSSLGSVNQSHVILSPTPQSQPFVRWSTSKLNSTASSPCASTRSSFNARQPNGSISPLSVRSSFSYRQPYMGWRSQERLTRPRTPAERLANTLLSHANQTHQPQESPEIQTSIKEVTSAIVHYVSGLRPEDTRGSYDSQDTTSQRSSSVSPRGSQKLYWLESSFVGTKPLDSPQTPVTLSESSNPGPPSSLRLELQNHNGKQSKKKKRLRNCTLS